MGASVDEWGGKVVSEIVGDATGAPGIKIAVGEDGVRSGFQVVGPVFNSSSRSERKEKEKLTGANRGRE